MPAIRPDLDLPIAVQDAPLFDPPMSAISVRNLTYEFPRKRVLTGVNLDVEHGEIVSIMGSSGSGKTTLLKLLTGLVKPTGGQILIDGEDIVPMPEARLDEVRLKLGMVFQYAALFDSLSVYDNIAFGVVRHRRPMRHELDRLVKDRLADVGLEGIERLHPSELSGGMQKRVGLARALAMNPAIVFYDEPTSGLDPISEYKIDALIMSTRERKHVTSIVVSHHLPSVFRISDRVAMLHAGRIAFVGTPDEIRSSTLPEIQAFVYPETQLPFRAQEHEDFI